MRHATGPLIALGALVVGILAGQRAGPAPARTTLMLGMLAVAGAWVVAGNARRVTVAIALALLGCAVTQRALDGLAQPGVQDAIATGADTHVRGTLTADPDGQRFGASAYVHLERLDRIVLAKATGDDAGRLRLLEAGDRVELTGRFEAVPVVGFDARAKWRHASALLVDTRVLAFAPAAGPLWRVANASRVAILRGAQPLSPTSRALFAGFLLGDTRAIPDDVSADYRASGLSHLLAVSGANVAFVLLVFAPLLRRLPLGARTLAAFAILLAFAAATRFEPSVLRASALTTVTILATFVGRPVAPLRALAMAIIALLLIDPFLLHSVGFLLSCAASAGIAAFAHPLAARVPGPRLLGEALAVSIAAQVGVTPVLLLAFGSVPVVTPITNLLAAPAAEALGVFGLAAGVAGGAIGPLGRVASPLLEGLIAWVSTVAHAGAAFGVELHLRSAIVLVACAVLATVARRARRARRTVPDPPAR